MATKNLLIVESPTKVKAIKRFLGNNYDVAASQGHVRDLPRSQMGVDIENDFEPKYITIRGKGDLLADLRKKVKKADRIYLATDPDREGEAISWHLTKALKLEDSDKKVERITFNEITKKAVKESFDHARAIDMNLVDAQQARRVLDRLVGYRISPILWAKIKRGLSAGRVQSVALRIICDREEEIAAFIPEEYWTLDVSLAIPGEKKPIVARYYGEGSEKRELKSGEETAALIKSLENAKFMVEDVRKTERGKKAPNPFTTSTLQQEASKSLGFGTQKTMRIAQQLYEGVDVKGRGTIGLITYLRTDSTRVSDEAKAAAAAYIKENYGADHAAAGKAEEKKGGRIQDAHEAIRPADVTLSPVMIKDELSRDQFKLYQLIWRRFVASQMADARYETTSVRISAKESRFTLSASRTVFDGFLSVYTDEDDKIEKQTISKGIEKGTVLKAEGFEDKQHFTTGPAHYTEASLVHDLEELGIGRPSTYAPTISTIMGRHYVSKEGKNLFVTELGEAVNRMMKEAFPSIVDVNFTANMEKQLDDVEGGQVKWKAIVENFYPDFSAQIDKAEKELEQVTIADEVSEEVCELCGRNMVIKYGPHGKFLACPGFPECRNTKPYYEKTGVMCPKCGKDIVRKKTRKGRVYYGCIDNPACDFMSWQKPSKSPCPKCGALMVERGNKLSCTNPDCGHVCDKPEEEQ
ncbi:MAG: type I DNA topoisomerase [Lachnospiraceae bacterium]|nr:type I DNA topoisomerase [Lachnospiraceae bacterium]